MLGPWSGHGFNRGRLRRAMVPLWAELVLVALFVGVLLYQGFALLLAAQMPQATPRTCSEVLLFSGSAFTGLNAIAPM